tara:strand:- start:436 stop:573 length:138 start_codon:yes stop_codon:yes gene_type:complete
MPWKCGEKATLPAQKEECESARVATEVGRKKTSLMITIDSLSVFF